MPDGIGGRSGYTATARRRDHEGAVSGLSWRRRCFVPACSMRLSHGSTQTPPRNYPESCPQREPKRPRGHCLRSYDLLVVLCGASAPVSIWEGLVRFHLLLHKGKELHVDKTIFLNLRDDVSSQAVDPDEIEANRFAAELLMPKNLILKDVKQADIDLENEDDLLDLARRYRVGIQALTFRLANLGLISSPRGS